jgi:selenocysteine-specific elongation factor
LGELFGSGQIIPLEVVPVTGLSRQADLLVTTPGYWDSLAGRLRDELHNYHQAFPLRRGMPKEELKSRLKIPVRLFNATMRRLVSDGAMIEIGPLVQIPGHEIRFNPAQQRRIDQLLARFAASPYSPPSVKESQAEIGEDVYAALLDSGQLQAVAPDVVFRKEDYDRMVREVRRLLETRGTLTAAEVRDHFNTSRRYVLALLEHLDALGLTIREGDVRRLKNSKTLCYNGLKPSHIIFTANPDEEKR